MPGGRVGVVRVEGEVWEGRNPGESLKRTRGRGKSDARSSSTPLHKDNKMLTFDLSPVTRHPWQLPHPEAVLTNQHVLSSERGQVTTWQKTCIKNIYVQYIQ